jgi:hypothetical protein
LNFGAKKKKPYGINARFYWERLGVYLGNAGNIMRTDCEQGKKKAQKLLSPAPLFSQTKQK